MAVAFVDQVAAFLADPVNLGAFPAAVGLSGFAGSSFVRRYGQGGFQVDGVTLGVPTGLQLQEYLTDGGRVGGSRERRSDHPERHWYELRVRREVSGWVDAAFTTSAQLALHAVPGSIQLGPGGDLAPAGVSEPGPPARHQLRFQIPVGTDAFALAYTMGVYVFAASDPSPVADLRRILGLRSLLEDDSQFLASLDGPADQRPYLFIQVYPKGVLQTPLSESAVVKLFAAADVLAAFLTIPAV